MSSSPVHRMKNAEGRRRGPVVSPAGATASHRARARWMLLAIGIGVAVVGGAACAREPTDATPIGTLRSFLDAMDRAEQDERALAEAYALLDADARGALAERARDASALGGGREFAPWEMLAQGRFRLRFAFPAYGAMRERVEGDRAVVTVRGQDGARADVPLVREDGRWRLTLHLPRAARGSASGDAPTTGAAPTPAEGPAAPQ